MGATFTPLVCSVYGLLHPDALALLRLQSARASDAHVNRIGGRKAFINLLLEHALRCLVCHPEAQRHHHPHGPAEDPRCFASSSRPDRHPVACEPLSSHVCSFKLPLGSEYTADTGGWHAAYACMLHPRGAPWHSFVIEVRTCACACAHMRSAHARVRTIDELEREKEILVRTSKQKYLHTNRLLRPKR